MIESLTKLKYTKTKKINLFLRLIVKSKTTKRLNRFERPLLSSSASDSKGARENYDLEEGIREENKRGLERE